MRRYPAFLIACLLVVTLACVNNPSSPDALSADDLPGANDDSASANGNVVTVIVTVPVVPINAGPLPPDVPGGNGDGVVGTSGGTFCPLDTTVRADCSQDSWARCDCVPSAKWLDDIVGPVVTVDHDFYRDLLRGIIGDQSLTTATMRAIEPQVEQDGMEFIWSADGLRPNVILPDGSQWDFIANMGGTNPTFQWVRVN